MKPAPSKNTFPRAETPKAESASVMVLAVWTLFFLGALALAVGAYVSSQLAVAGYIKTDTRAYWLARSAIETAMRGSDQFSNEAYTVEGVLENGYFRADIYRTTWPAVTNFDYKLISASNSPSRSCLAGTAKGWASYDEDGFEADYNPTSYDARVDFVFDVSGESLLYWYEF